MTLHDFFEQVVRELEQRKIFFALAGGLIASVYRSSPRATQDLDFLILSDQKDENVACEINTLFQLKSHFLRKADLEGGPKFAIKKKSTPVFIVSGRAQGQIGVDFLLSNFPWAETALERAQKNCIDFGFGPVPCLTVEDLLIAKIYAQKNQSTRFMDLDDIRSIFESNAELDLNYLSAQMKTLKLAIPEPVKGLAPKDLLRLIRQRP